MEKNLKFKTEYRIRMYDTDSAEILFFGAQYRLISFACEELLTKEGFPGYSWKNSQNKEIFTFVVVHSEADYLAPLRVSDLVDISVSVNHIGQSSFGFYYEIRKTSDDVLAGTAATRHVCINKVTFKKQIIPDILLRVLNKYKI